MGVAATLHPALIIVAWTFGGGGMGLLYPRVTMLMLAHSTPVDQGKNSAALSIAEATAAATAIAGAGLVAAVLGGGVAGFVGAFALATIVALFGVVPASRIEPSAADRLDQQAR